MIASHERGSTVSSTVSPHPRRSAEERRGGTKATIPGGHPTVKDLKESSPSLHPGLGARSRSYDIPADAIADAIVS